MIDPFISGQKGDLVSFDETGGFSIDGQNYKSSDGTLCEENAKQIVAACGGEITDMTHKPEYNPVNVKSRQTVSGN